MNKHFSDARYYLGRAASHLKLGLSEELAPVAERLQERLGIEAEEPPEPETRAERVRVAATQGFRRVRRAREPDEQTA